MQLTAAQKEELLARIGQYEAKRDQLLAEANLAQGAAIALRQLLNEIESGDEQPGS